uniref:CBFD_NFYB_HMF domain-containing protein n=1 Tax=Meloidogyne hapla TaxID=6305 RepID=A0A1I8B0D1_MELHA
MDESMVNEFIDVTQQQQQQASSSNSSNSGIILEQDRFLPIANITRVMKRVIPPEGKLSKEAKECIQECITEFLLERRKTISGEDILTAFRTLGFDEYVTPLEDFMRKYREANKLQSSQAATLVQQMGSNNNANNSNNNSSNTKEAEATATDGNQQMVYLQEQQLVINPSYNLQPLQVFYDAANGQYFIPVQQDNEQIIEQNE